VVVQLSHSNEWRLLSRNISDLCIGCFNLRRQHRSHLAHFSSELRHARRKATCIYTVQEPGLVARGAHTHTLAAEWPALAGSRRQKDTNDQLFSFAGRERERTRAGAKRPLPAAVRRPFDLFVYTQRCGCFVSRDWNARYSIRITDRVYYSVRPRFAMLVQINDNQLGTAVSIWCAVQCRASKKLSISLHFRCAIAFAGK
jgi:hypothetical protein